jgi:oxygen-independent coproporphyrinogen-3 oxidase
VHPDHISTYGLTFERGTSFWGRLNRGELSRAEEETEGLDLVLHNERGYDL